MGFVGARDQNRIDILPADRVDRVRSDIGCAAIVGDLARAFSGCVTDDPKGCSGEVVGDNAGVVGPHDFPRR